MCMNVLWFNFIDGLIFVCGSLALSYQSPACRTHHFAPLYSRKKCKFDTNAKKSFVFFSKVVGQKLDILSFFVFQQKKTKRSVL